MILSNDTINMRPPYEITTGILVFVSSISEKIGEINAKYLSKQTPQLRKQNKIKTIHSSLHIEGNTLTEEQVTAIIENKRVIGMPKDILEVKNAIRVYNDLSAFRPDSEKSFLAAHKILMDGLVGNAGQYRQQGVGIVKGSVIEHVAPPFERVPCLMKDIFHYLKNEKEIALIKSCVFHYEMEFIHPFIDGNGRMGRLWQTLILMNEYPVFEFLPFETLISKNQKEYYKALSKSDGEGKSTAFIEYMLSIIDKSLASLLDYNNRTLKDTDRLEYFLAQRKGVFTRKDYMNVFKEISTATASRDLKKGLERSLFIRQGDKKTTTYNTVETI
jgi:Fic family protein